VPLTRRLILQKARRHPTQTGRLRRLVSTRFQVLFHSPPGVLFTIPSRYLSAIGHQGVFRLTRWSSQIRTGFLGPRTTWEKAPRPPCRFAYGGLTHYAGPSQILRLRHERHPDHPAERSTQLPQPHPRNACRLSHADGLASSAFARHYSRNRICFLFLRVLRCFTSPRALHAPYTFRCR
jgi:hypothetical protein